MEHEDKPIRVLHVLTGLSSGGAESFIMNVYRNIDRTKVQFDFLLRSGENVYKEELETMGSKVYITASFPRHFIQNALQTAVFFKEHHYDIVHVHANALLYMYALECAKKNGVKCRIIHSHNAAMAHMRLLPLHNLNKGRITELATDFFACSDIAGKWMFPGEYAVIHNAVDLDAFRFDQKKREEIRAQHKIGDTDFVIGHIGRFTEQKNHDFLIDIFQEVIRSRPNAKLMLLGDGPLKDSMMKKVERLNMSDKVLFLGARKDVSDLINAFDLFVFPSVYEGLGIVLLEAQANGLPCVISEAIPNQALFGSVNRKISLEQGVAYWAEAVLSADTRRVDLSAELRSAGYDIKMEAKRLQEFYESKVRIS